VAGKGGTQSLLIAQASTLVAVPICAVLLYGMTTSKAIMGELRNGRASIALGAVGLAVLGWLNIRLLLTLVG
jgi:Mn2+/Fe2+ NRAMP family transporter